MPRRYRISPQLFNHLKDIMTKYPAMLPPHLFARNLENTRFLPCEDCGGVGWIEDEYWHGRTPCTNPQCQDGLVETRVEPVAMEDLDK